jgi:capsule polysaccharide export protein KpsE/RkpR
MRKILSLAIAAFLFAPAVMAEGEVYRWKDANGVWHYSDQPQPGAELVKKTGGRSSSSNSSTPSTPATAPAAASENGVPPLSSEAVQQVRREAATAKSEQCKKATAEYQNVITARRLYKQDEKGNRIFLNSAEIDAARLEARSTRDITCGPSP